MMDHTYNLGELTKIFLDLHARSVNDWRRAINRRCRVLCDLLDFCICMAESDSTGKAKYDMDFLVFQRRVTSLR